MPLPAALLARLKRRGIVQDEEEEVIAESYDDDTTQGKKVDQRTGSKQQAISAEQLRQSGEVGCPNKWNPYHWCTSFCHDHWGVGTPEVRLATGYNRRRLRMLKKYPLPDGWNEVYDPGVARHYYWNTETDEVSWLSPTHPRAVIGEAAPKMGKIVFEKAALHRELALAKAHQQMGEMGRIATKEGTKRKALPLSDGEDSAGNSEDDDDDDGGDDSDDEKRSKRRGGKKPKTGGEKPQLTDFDRLRKAKKRGIDPMDPAAYSDISTGKWSSGLDMRGEAKTGVDITASGPLFQSRPYPAPGAILRKNAEAGKK